MVGGDRIRDGCVSDVELVLRDPVDEHDGTRAAS
jgi:hypothetical protein